MTLDVLLPTGSLLHATGLLRLSASTLAGSVGVLPHRLDFVAVVRPGIVAYTAENQGERFLAVDQGVVAKRGLQVRVSVRRAIAGGSLAELRASVEREFRLRNEEDRELRALLEKLETGLMSRLSRLRHA